MAQKQSVSGIAVIGLMPLARTDAQVMQVIVGGPVTTCLASTHGERDVSRDPAFSIN